MCFSDNSLEVDKSDSEARGEQPGQVRASNTQPVKSQREKNSEYLEAAKRGDLQTVLTLLNSGADILCKKYGNSGLHLAAQNGRDEVVKALLDRGLDVNTRGQYDMTPLMDAASSGHESTFNILLEAGADPNNARSRDDMWCLKQARENFHNEMVDLLLEYGARDPKKWSEKCSLL